MKAMYMSNMTYPGNPFVEALPPILGGKALIEALGYYPVYDAGSRHLPAKTRLQQLGNLYEVYQPVEMTVQLYYQVYSSMQYSFAQKGTVADVQDYHRNYSDIQNRRITAATGGGNSFSVIGISGLGKSRALQQVLSLFPTVIEHEEYDGQLHICKQIPYIVAQTPYDGSIKALCLDVMLQVDEICGTQYYRRALSNRLTGDMMVSQLSQITKNNNLGLLVIDELQNISYAKSGGGIRLLNFLVQLINSAHLSICMVGTPQALSTLQQEFRSARRSTGLVYDRYANNEEFSSILKTIWKYQYTRYQATLTPELHNWLYRRTQGIPDILIKLLYRAQQNAIMDGNEIITIDVLDKAYNSSMKMVDGFLAELNESPKTVVRSQNIQAGDLSVQSPHEMKPLLRHDLHSLVADAKAHGVLLVDALHDYIEEIAI